MLKSRSLGQNPKVFAMLQFQFKHHRDLKDVSLPGMVVMAVHQMAKAREPQLSVAEVLKANYANIRRVYGVDLQTSTSAEELDLRQILEFVKHQ